MNVSCIICSEIFLPHSDVYTTQCGHLFHYVCLLRWLESSRTCPQCRHRTSEKNIYRLYFNTANADHIVDDVVTLQNKLDNLQFQMTLKDKDVKILEEKYNKTKCKNMALRSEVAELENKMRGHDSMIHALKDQISFFKGRSKERDKLIEELSQTKNKLKDLEMVQLVMNGSREEVNDMLRNENNIESLVILSATLKKALLDAEKKKMHSENKLKQLQNEVSKYRREISHLQLSNDELSKELQSSKANWEQEKEQLTKIVKNLNKNGSDGNTSIIKRLLTESPVPLKIKCCDKSNEIINLDESNSPVQNRVVKILNSDSPYLPVKTNSISHNSSIINYTKYIKNSPTRKVSIFRQPIDKSREVIKSAVKEDEVAYNGLGGQSKEDIFPSPRSVVRKRIKATSLYNVSSAKLRKLNPYASSKI